MTDLDSKKFVSTLKMMCKEYNLQINVHQLRYFLKHVITDNINTDPYLEEMKYFENYK